MSDFKKVTLTSLAALEAQAKKTGDRSLFLIINTNKPLVKKKDHVQRIIPVPHRYASFDSTRVLLITPANSLLNNYVELLRPLTTKHDNVEQMSIKKLKSLNKSKLKALATDYDVILADYRVHALLPGILGGQFYLKNKKVPYIFKLSSLQTFDAKLVQDSVDLKFVKAQIKSVINNVSFLLSPDCNITFKMYDFDTTTTNALKHGHILTNIEQVIQFIQNKDNRPVTNWSRTHEITSIYLKTTNSASLPLLKKKEDE
jgi:ribosome biogenesis protein UTP30